MRVLTDGDLDAVTPADAVEAMLDALRLRGSGLMQSPSRVHADLGAGRVVMTAGSGTGWYGYRVYDTLPTSAGQQVVVVHDAGSGDVVAVHVGNRLGVMRTGALGGAAARLLGPTHPSRVAVVGAGRQAWAQLWALTAALDVTSVAVASRTMSSRAAFAARARSEFRLDARAVPDPRAAVTGADVVILATTSPTPVIDSAWLAQDVLVTTLGPKQVGRCEFDPDLLTGADLTATDSPGQLHAYTPPALAATMAGGRSVVDLAAFASRDEPAARRGRRVYLSVGLAGTEAHLLHHLVRGDL